MAAQSKLVRQSISLPPRLARRVRALARTQRTSANRVLVELIEQGIEASRQKEKAFFDLAERFRRADDPAQAKALGEEMGRFIFGR